MPQEKLAETAIQASADKTQATAAFVANAQLMNEVAPGSDILEGAQRDLSPVTAMSAGGGTESIRETTNDKLLPQLAALLDLSKEVLYQVYVTVTTNEEIIRNASVTHADVTKHINRVI